MAILFIAALILISGFIAYFGDLLGRRMGKKRLSLFNLRPRYTAIVVTTFTGMLISAIAFTCFISFDKQFRKVFTQGEKILAQNDHLTRSNSRLEVKNKSLLATSRRLVKLVALRQKEVEAARRYAQKARIERDRAQTAVTRLEQEIASRLRELAGLREKKDVAEKELASRTRELESVRGELAEAKDNLQTAQTKLAAASANLSEAEAKLATTNAKLASTLNELKKKEDELAEAEKTVAEIGIESAVQRSRAYILRQGDEVARTVISPGQSAFSLKGDLYSVLQQASQNVTKLGAKPGDNGRAVTVVYREIRQSLGRKYAVLVIDQEPKFIDMALERIGSSLQDVLVQVVAAVNTLPGEQVPVELRLYVNYLVYPAGDKIASLRVDGRLSEGRILLSLMDFLQKDVSESAIRAGIVPVANPDPRLVVGKNPGEQVEGLLAVVDSIKAKDAPVNLSAYASHNIYAADPLSMDNMRFDISIEN